MRVDQVAPSSSQALAALLFYEEYLNLIVIAMTLLFNVFKYYRLGYVDGRFTRVNVMILLYAVVSYVKRASGDRANRSESIPYAVVLFLTGAFSLALNFVFMRLQTYVMVYEFGIHSIQVFFTILEMIIGLLLIFMFASIKNADRERQKEEEDRI